MGLRLTRNSDIKVITYKLICQAHKIFIISRQRKSPTLREWHGAFPTARSCELLDEPDDDDHGPGRQVHGVADPEPDLVTIHPFGFH